MVHGQAMNYPIPVTTHRVVVGQPVLDIGMVLPPHFHQVNNGGGLDRQRPNVMGMPPWKVALTMHPVEPTMQRRQTVCWLNISTTTV